MRKERAPISPFVLTSTLAGIVLAARTLRNRRLDAISLNDKVAIVTGGSRGLGFLLARELAREGCKLVIAARDEAELNRARDILQLEGRPVLTVVADLSQKHAAEGVVAAAYERFGGVDILINNAGIIQVAPLEDCDESHFKASMDLMFWGTLHTTLAAIPHLKQRGGGAIVNIASFGGMVAVPHLLPYVSAKFAEVGLSQGLHAELKRHNIIVTTVAPGTMRTGSHVQALFGGKASKEYSWFALGATLPGFSTGAERAARQIVTALKRRAPFLSIGVPARVGIRFANLFPGLTAEILAAVNSVLPKPSLTPTNTQTKGAQLAKGARTEANLPKLISTLGIRPVRRFQDLRP